MAAQRKKWNTIILSNTIKSQTQRRLSEFAFWKWSYCNTKSSTIVIMSGNVVENPSSMWEILNQQSWDAQRSSDNTHWKKKINFLAAGVPEINCEITFFTVKLPVSPGFL